MKIKFKYSQSYFSQLLSILIVGVVVIVTSVSALYFEDINQAKIRLQHLTGSLNNLVNTVYHFDSIHSENDVEGGAVAATTSQILDGLANRKHFSINQSDEILVARQEGDQLVFMTPSSILKQPIPNLSVDMAEKQAIPMKLGLRGLQGVIESSDYRGQAVIAAYQYLDGLDLALVAKFDIDTVREPYIHALIKGLALALVITFLFALFLLAKRPNFSYRQAMICQGSVQISMVIILMLAVNHMLKDEIPQRALRLQANIAQVNASMMGAIARFDQLYSQEDHSDGARAATLDQITRAGSAQALMGLTGEIVIGERRGDWIHFLWPSQITLQPIPPVMFDSPLAEPMHLALNGQSGSIEGLDYLNNPVIAAYQTVPELNIAIVAKTHVSELRAGYQKAIIAAITSATMIGLMVFVILGLITQRAIEGVENFQRSEDQDKPSAYLLFATGCVSIAIFICDVAIPLGVAAGVPACLIVMLSWWYRKSNTAIILGFLATLIIILAYIFTFDRDADFWRVMVNRSYAIAMVWVFALVLEKAIRNREELKSAKVQSEISQKKFEDLFLASPDALISVNSDGDIISANKKTEELFGYSHKELLSINVDTLVPKNFRDNHKYKRASYQTNPINQPMLERSIDLFGEHKNGNTFPVEVSLSSITTEEGILPIASIKDVSKAKALEASLVEQKNKAELATQAKTEFLANMSHEIRTPMNSVLGFLSIALDSGRLPDDLAKHIRTSHGSAQSLLVIINDILDISKFESGNVSLEKLDFKLYDALVSSVEMQESLCLKKNLSLSLKYHPQLSAYYRGDPNRLKQVFVNLLGNSVKFTEQGSVSIEVEPADKPGWLHFMIKDTGVGIAPDHLPSIFDSFTQADESTTRRFGGTGLGTTISKQIVEAMGGRIWAESELNKGSIFHFEVYMQAVEEEDVVHTYQEFGHDTTAPEKPERCYRVLLVDDIEQNLELGNIRFTELGHTVDLACNGSEAVEAYKNNHYDVILMDIQMPVMDGLEATRIIRGLEKNSSETVPIIALTASVLQEDVDLCHEAGMTDIVGKPINFNELFAVIDEVLGESDQQSVTLTTKAPKLEERESKLLELMPLVPVADVETAIKTWRNPDLYLKNLNKFIESNQENVQQLSVYVENNQYSDVIRLAHGLKGVAGNLSLLEIYESSDAINKTAEDLCDLTVAEILDHDKVRLLKDELNIHCLNLSNEYNKAKELIQTVVKTSSDSSTSEDVVSSSTDNVSLDVPQLKIKLTRLQETLLSGSVSDELLEECLNTSRDYVDSSLINQVQSQVDDFDFEAAEKLIGKILSHLDIYST